MNPLAPLYRLADRLRRRHAEGSSANTGRVGEDLAHRWLRNRKFTVVARNWRPPQGGGEIDIVAWEQDVLVFVEVKTLSSSAWSAPERAISADKLRALRRTARDYTRRCGADPDRVRFDVLAITGERVEHLRGAFAGRAEAAS